MRLTTFTYIALVALTAGCSVSSAPVESGDITRAEFMLFEAAGGRVSETEVVVDFTAGTYAVRECGQRQNTPCSSVEVTPKTLDPAMLSQLRDHLQSVAFRRLRASYDLSITPPDGSSGQLIVTTSVGEQSVSWDRRATRPDVLVEVECRLLQLAGWLILCS